MSAIEPRFARSKVGAGAADFMAFVGDRKTEQVLKSFVLEQAMPNVHIAIGNIDDAISHLSKLERSPRLLLVDLHGSVMPLSDMARLAEVCEPSVQVVTVGDHNDVSLFRSLLNIGVRDYLVKPLTVEWLKRTVDVDEGKVNPVALAREGKTIAFAGTRGGVGVTTIAVNLAWYLAEDTSRRVAYIDLDVYGGAVNSMLALESNNGLIDVMQNVHRLDPAYVERTMVAKGNRLFVLSAELPLGTARPFEGGGLGHVLDLLTDSFHYVLLDIGNRADPLAEEAFDHASRVYVIADRSVYSTRETARLLSHLENRSHNPVTSVILNNSNAATAGKVQTPDFLTAIGRPIPHEVPFEAKALAFAENLGELPSKRSAQAFKQTIAQIASDLTGQPTVVARGFLQKLGLKK